MTGDVQSLNGVLLSYARAADVVGVIDRLAMLCKPQVLSRKVVELRADLIQSLTRANTRDDTSTEVVEKQEVLALAPDVVIDPNTAAAMLNITADGVRWLCKNNQHLVATKVGTRWWIDPQSVERYLRSKGAGDGHRDTEFAV
jgi:hypothetical protein